jgi:hypothetical protein
MILSPRSKNAKELQLRLRHIHICVRYRSASEGAVGEGFRWGQHYP